MSNPTGKNQYTGGGAVRAGALVKFRTNVDKGDRGALMRVLEMRGSRALVAHHGTGMKITPTSSHLVKDLTTAGGRAAQLSAYVRRMSKK